jgi:hypothetical protein
MKTAFPRNHLVLPDPSHAVFTPRTSLLFIEGTGTTATCGIIHFAATFVI